MVGILRSVYDRKTGKCQSREIVEVLDMSDSEFYEPMVEIEAKYFMEKFTKERREKNVQN